MIDLLAHPFGFISNRLQIAEEGISFSHSDRSLVLGIVMGLLAFGNTLKSIDDFRTLFLNYPGDSSIFSFVLSALSILVFLGIFLRIMVFSKGLVIDTGSLTLFDYWPFAFSKSVIALSEIERITISTLFSHLSRKATVFVSIKAIKKGNLKQVYSCLRKDLNELVDQLETSLKGKGFQVTVNQENSLQQRI